MRSTRNQPNVTRRVGSSITKNPTLNQAKELVFRMTLEDTEVILHVRASLHLAKYT